METLRIRKMKIEQDGVTLTQSFGQHSFMLGDTQQLSQPVCRKLYIKIKMLMRGEICFKVERMGWNIVRDTKSLTEFTIWAVL